MAGARPGVVLTKSGVSNRLAVSRRCPRRSSAGIAGTRPANHCCCSRSGLARRYRPQHPMLARRSTQPQNCSNRPRRSPQGISPTLRLRRLTPPIERFATARPVSRDQPTAGGCVGCRRHEAPARAVQGHAAAQSRPAARDQLPGERPARGVVQYSCVRLTRKRASPLRTPDSAGLSKVPAG